MSKKEAEPDLFERVKSAIPDPEELGKWTDFLQGAALIAGLLLYGVVRIAVDSFYGRLGATPDEVGLGYAGTLTRAAVGAVGFGLMLAILLVAVYTYNTWVKGKTYEPILDKVIYVALGVGGAIFGYLALARIGVSTIFLVAPAFWIVGALASWPNASKKGRAAILLIVLILAAAMGGGALSRGKEQAEKVLDGWEIRPNPVWTILPVNASCVSLEWTDSSQTAPMGLGDSFLYLGAADGTALLLAVPGADGEVPVLHRLQLSSIRLEHNVTADRASCPQS